MAVVHTNQNCSIDKGHCYCDQKSKQDDSNNDIIYNKKTHKCRQMLTKLLNILQWF